MLHRKIKHIKKSDIPGNIAPPMEIHKKHPDRHFGVPDTSYWVCA